MSERIRGSYDDAGYTNRRILYFSLLYFSSNFRTMTSARTAALPSSDPFTRNHDVEQSPIPSHIVAGNSSLVPASVLLLWQCFGAYVS